MRITGGRARGIPLRVPTKGDVRPATDYIREAVFNSLAAWIPGAVVLDLFSGTGAYALEALSRGAAQATSIDLKTASELAANAAAVAKSMGVEKLPLQIITGDALQAGLVSGPFNLVFADPPWGLWEKHADVIVHNAVSYVGNSADATVVLEAPGGFVVPVPAGWKLRKVIGKGKGQPAASVFVPLR
jgi:16S rRNA (guanine966-N2)-methyltransferase